MSCTMQPVSIVREDNIHGGRTMSVDVLKAESTVWVEVMQWRNKQNIGTVSNLQWLLGNFGAEVRSTPIRSLVHVRFIS